MSEMVGMSDPEDDSLCFSLNECLDGAISAFSTPMQTRRALFTPFVLLYVPPPAQLAVRSLRTRKS
jgi:hypothetical protein